MKKTLIITVGTRDVQVSDDMLLKKVGKKAQELIDQRFPARIGGQLFQKYKQQLKDHFSFPIIEPLIRELGKSVNTFSHVILVVTDQDPKTGDKYYNGDTLHFGEIIQDWLKEKGFKTDAFTKKSILKVKKDVVYLDSMFQFFKDHFANNKELADAEEIHLLNQGGIDAVNYGLLLNLLYQHQERVRLYNVNEKNKSCALLDFGNQFGYEQEEVRLLEALQRYDYAALKSMHLLPPDTRKWGAYAEARLHFDFEAARRHLTGISRENRTESDHQKEALHQIETDNWTKTQELYWNACICYQREAYVDFLLRFFRIVEEMYKHIAFKHLGITSVAPRQWNRIFGPIINNPGNAALKDHLDKYAIGKFPLQYIGEAAPNINTTIAKAIAVFYEPEKIKFLDFFEPLSQARNKSIGAHDFEPTSLGRILEITGCATKEDFEAKIGELGEFLGVGNHPFDQINGFIRQSIAK